MVYLSLIYILVCVGYSVNSKPGNVNEIEGFFTSILRYSKNALNREGLAIPPRVDLVFILDGSVEHQKDSSYLRRLIHLIVNEFSISPSTTRVGIILCSNKPYLYFGLDSFVNKECTLRAVESVRALYKEGCDLEVSLKLAYRLLLKSKHQRSFRHKTKKLVVIINTSQRYKGAVGIASKLRGTGSEIYLVAVGKGVVKSKVRLLVSQPVSDHYFWVTTASLLMNYKSFIRSKGIHRKCRGDGYVYDECGRRCKCSNDILIDCHRIRQSFLSMTVADRRRYINVVKMASTVQPYKRIYDEITSYHPRWFDDVHQSEYFFPWHRLYILTFENFLRQIDCRVTVPYWDWVQTTSDNRLWLSDVWYPGPHGLGGNGEGPDKCVRNGPFSKEKWTISSALNKSCLTREFNGCWADRLPKIADKNRLLSLRHDEFKEFERNIRERFHNYFHNSIGGIMALDTSSNAPEFWLHHCFLDKIWNDWQMRGHKFKHQYYYSVKKNLPGTTLNGSLLIDLSKQPSCVKVHYAHQKSRIQFAKDNLSNAIKQPKLVENCYFDNDESIDSDKTKNASK